MLGQHTRVRTGTLSCIVASSPPVKTLASSAWPALRLSLVNPACKKLTLTSLTIDGEVIDILLLLTVNKVRSGQILVRCPITENVLPLHGLLAENPAVQLEKNSGSYLSLISERSA